MRILKTGAILLVIALSAAIARAEGLEAVWNTTREQVVSDLQELADFCDENKLLGGRNRCYEVILAFSPDHEQARKILRYRMRDGEWTRGSYKAPGNHNEEMEPTYIERLRTIVTTARQTYLDALRAADPREEKEVYKGMIADLLRLDPDDADARYLNGEARRGTEWVLIETVRAERRHEELKSRARDSLDTVPAPHRIDPTEEEHKLGVKWNAAMQGEWWRGVATVGDAELEHAVKCMDISDKIFDEAFGLGYVRPKGCGFYLLTGKGQAKTVLENHPAFTPAQRDYLLGLAAGWIPKKQVFFQWSDLPALRLDGSVRMSIGIMVLRSFGISIDKGWAWEGIGTFLVELITGSHRIVFVSRNIETTTERTPRFDIERRMKRAGADWISIANLVYEAGTAPDLQIMARKDVNQMTPEDLVVSYSLIRFMVEGHEKIGTKFLIFHGGGQDFREMVEQVFELPLPEFEAKFVRWLREMSN